MRSLGVLELTEERNESLFDASRLCPYHKKKTSVPFESEVFFAFRRAAKLLLMALPLQKFALLVLAHFLASLLDHAPHNITSLPS